MWSGTNMKSNSVWLDLSNKRATLLLGRIARAL